MVMRLVEQGRAGQAADVDRGPGGVDVAGSTPSHGERRTLESVPGPAGLAEKFAQRGALSSLTRVLAGGRLETRDVTQHKSRAGSAHMTPYRSGNAAAGARRDSRERPALVAGRTKAGGVEGHAPVASRQMR